MTVDFGASDGVMDEKQKEEAKGGAVSMSLSLLVRKRSLLICRESKPSQLKLTPDVLADIYLKKINNWNDKRIDALNSGTNFRI